MYVCLKPAMRNVLCMSHIVYSFLIPTQHTVSGSGINIFEQIFDIELLLLLNVFKSPESRNEVFSGWSVCLLSAKFKKKLQ